MPVAANATPKVSVIIPSYKTAQLIARCLDTVMAQTFQDFEAIIVNDGSPDTPELEKVLQPYMDRIVYIKQENKRCAGARNTAIQHARGEFLAFLDSDDTWYPEHLASQVQQFVDDPSLAVGGADKLVTDVMASRGYPMGDFEQRAADVSVNYPGVVQNYRAARSIVVRHNRGQAGTEELRQAMVHFRSLFDELLDLPKTEKIGVSHERAS